MPRKLSFHPLFMMIFLLSACGKPSQPAPHPILPPDDAAQAQLREIIGDTSRADSVFAPDVERLLPPLDSVESVLGGALGPESGVKLYGVIIPFRQSIITAPGGVIFIGLNHYLGKDYEGYRGVFPSYLRHRKSIERMPVDIMQARVASLYPPEFSASPTLLNRLLYQGALLETANEKINAPDSTLLGLTAEELKWCEENEGNIWLTLIDRNLLYSTDAAVADRLLQPAANSNMINANAPGQAVLYTALKLVRTYCKKTGTSAKQILENKLYNDNQTLIKSEYAPVRQ